jgi:hypothetical protein
VTSQPVSDATDPPAPRRPPSLWIRFVAMLAVPPFVWWLAAYDVLPHVKVCAFQVVTGRPCPGCGMTRAMLHLAQGDVVGSLRMHPVGIVLAGLFFAALAATGYGLVTGTDPFLQFLERRGMRLGGVMLVLLLGVWLVRGFLVPDWSPDPIR